MAEYRIIPRTESELDPIVYNNDGVTRRPHLTGERWAVVHYPGVETDWDNWPWPGASTSDLLYRLDQIATADGKRNEYNYLIGRQPEDAFRVHEYAGHYAGAHSLGENTQSVGVQLVYDTTGQPLLPQQIDAFRWLMWESRRTGLLAVDHLIEPHQRMPGASTDCPGPGAIAALPALRTPWTPPTPPTPGEGMTNEQFAIHTAQQREMLRKLGMIQTHTKYTREELVEVNDRLDELANRPGTGTAPDYTGTVVLEPFAGSLAVTPKE